MALQSANQISKTNFAAVNDVLVLDVAAQSHARFEFSGTYSYTASFESTVDGTNWFPILVTMTNAATTTTSHATANAAQAYFVDVRSTSKVRIRITAFTSAGTNKALIAAS